MFSNAKRGDRVWHFSKGWGMVMSVNKNLHYPMVVEFKNKIRRAFLLDGREHIDDINPMLYWNKLQLKNNEDEEIINFLKERIEPIGIYDFSEYWFLRYNQTNNYWSKGEKCFGDKDIGFLAFKQCPVSQMQDICDKLNLMKVSYHKFIEICKKLGWL